MPIETVVITGASAGVGRATAQAFAKRGARIGLLARGVDRLNATASEVRAEGGKALVLPAEVADADAVEAAAAAVEREFGPIDIWIDNAMATIFAPLARVSPDEYRRATEVTYLGCVYGTMAALKRMLPRNRGTIVQVGSALAYRAIPLQAPYCGAKHAVRGFTDSLRCELLHEKSNVHVTIVQIARAQHAAIRLGTEQNAAPSAADGRDLSARGGSRGSRLRCTFAAQGGLCCGPYERQPLWRKRVLRSGELLAGAARLPHPLNTAPEVGVP
jgi:NADP-dependent 3-hydroxy acid dehydrogenase YdfG